MPHPGETSHLCESAEMATERKPWLTAAEFRFGPTANSGPSSSALTRCLAAR